MARHLLAASLLLVAAACGPRSEVAAPRDASFSLLDACTTWPNEPASPALISDYGFSDAIPTGNDVPVGKSGWNILNPENGQPGPPEHTPGFAQSAVDTTAPCGSDVADFVYSDGMAGGWAPATMYYPHSQYQEVYAGFWWKPNSGWENHPSGVNKLAFWYTAEPGGSASNMSIQMYGPAPYLVHVVSEFIPPADTAVPAIRYPPNVTATAVVLGQWHRVEWYMKYGSNPSHTNGILKWWLDGVLQGSYTITTPPDPGFNAFLFSPTWGGVDGSKTQQDHYWFDHVHLSHW